MKKLRSDSAWAALTAEQKEKLESWLFVEQLSYPDALERAQKEFGIQSSTQSLSVFYHRLAEERKSRALDGAIAWMGRSSEPMEDMLIAEEAAFRMFTIAAYEMSLAGPKEAKELRKSMKLLLERRLQMTREQRTQLAARRENRLAGLSYSSKTIELAERLQELLPSDILSKEQLEKFLELCRVFDPRMMRPESPDIKANQG